MLLEGLHIPLTTPFHPDGRLNPRKLAANVARYSKTPAAGLIVLGPSGEPTLLSDDETREVLRTAAEAAAPEKVLIAGISRDSVRSTLDLANFAAEQNYDAILVGVPSIPRERTPRLAQGQQSILLRKSIGSRTAHLLPDDRRSLATPSHSAQQFDRVPHPRNSVALASHPNIIGMLDTGAQQSYRSARIRQLSDRTGFITRAVTVTHTFAAVTGTDETRSESGSRFGAQSPPRR